MGDDTNLCLQAKVARSGSSPHHFYLLWNSRSNDVALFIPCFVHGCHGQCVSAFKEKIEPKTALKGKKKLPMVT
ncbi:unnamed protein product [Lactuca virosa]|uniref:Uncharacterized protein n=1 Tax=Lactuca virosa TaxID=75947 RepID=A0AAU9PC98_9ASTR|nr:unnamed protein product [Lactuca virosa]